MIKIRADSLIAQYYLSRVSVYPASGGQDMVEINVEEFKRADLMTVTGRIDSSNASELEDQFKALSDKGHYQLVVDLNGIEYMSSAGLRALVAALRENKKHRGDLKIANPSNRMQEVLSLAGLDTVFEIFEDPTAAVGSY